MYYCTVTQLANLFVRDLTRKPTAQRRGHAAADAMEISRMQNLYWSFVDLFSSHLPLLSSLPHVEVGDPFIPPPSLLLCLSFTLGRGTLLWCFMTPWTPFPPPSSNTQPPHTYSHVMRVLFKIWAPCKTNYRATVFILCILTLIREFLEFSGLCGFCQTIKSWTNKDIVYHSYLY